MQQRVFISYCWKDGNWYADELEKQLKDDFNVIRDKSKLCVNDSIEDFMQGIADCDIVVLVLTPAYLKSDNCMKELAYLVVQPDWRDKVMLLVIDQELYKVDYQEVIIKYWDQALDESRKALEALKRKTQNRIKEVKNRSNICACLDMFFSELKNRNNPSQIAVVNEIYKMAKRDRTIEQKVLKLGEQRVLEQLKNHGNMTVPELSDRTKTSLQVTDRYISRLVHNQKVSYLGTRNKDKSAVYGVFDSKNLSKRKK